MNRRDAVSTLLAAAAAPAARPPRRVASLNPCLDAILVQVADRGQIAALSHYSREPGASSIGADLGRSFPVTHETAEEIIALAPDLVLADAYAAAPTRAALARLGIKVALFGLPTTVEQSCRQVLRLAGLVGRPDRGEALAARIRAAVAAAAPPPGAPRLTALVFQAGGAVAGKGAMMDDLLTRTGFDNAASRYGMIRTGDVPLERLIADPPQVLLAGQAQPGAPTWADRIVAHPALAGVAGRMVRIPFPQRLTFCGGPVLIEAAAMLAKAHRNALGALKPPGRAPA